MDADVPRMYVTAEASLNISVGDGTIDLRLGGFILGPFVMATLDTGRHESTVGYGARIGGAF